MFLFFGEELRLVAGFYFVEKGFVLSSFALELLLEVARVLLENSGLLQLIPCLRVLFEHLLMRLGVFSPLRCVLEFHLKTLLLQSFILLLHCEGFTFNFQKLLLK